MVLDLVGISIIILFFIRGYMKGIIIALFSVIAVLLGILCALKLSHKLAAWLYEKDIITSGWGQMISYLLLFIVVVILVRLVARLIEKAVQAVFLGLINRLLGGILYVFLGLVLWSSFLWIGSHIHLISASAVASSKTYTFFSGVAPWVCGHLGKLLPFATDIFKDLQVFFDHIDKKLP